ncbi:MAG: tryptophan 7-halogenase [Burkholderiales bacterium]|nr:tryptophan 7-halogenase [Burkholderiales bacterium]
MQECDVLVIGGGPAGSTAGALLAEKGWRVVVLDKDKHPRFHIGESLLPMNLPLFERLGVADQVAAIGMPKFGAEFVSDTHDKTLTYYFSEALDKNFPYAYQVRRSEFDHLLLNNCAAKGVSVHEEMRADGVVFDAEGATVEAQDKNKRRHCWRARFIVDASGRDTLLASRFDHKRRNKRHNSAALYAHFQDAARLPGKDAGNVSIFWFAHGWFWVIPLADGATSVGAVCWPAYLKSRKTDVETFFRDTIALCPAVAERLQDATLVSEVTGTGNYSYQATRMSGERYVLVGDAFAFIDPVFSTGVYLAMHSAFLAADAIDDCLRNPEIASRRLRAFERTMRAGLKTFSWFIYRVTTPAVRDLFMAPANVFRVREAMQSLLAGDVFRRTSLPARIRVFKTAYYLKSLARLPQSLAAYRTRQRNING